MAAAPVRAEPPAKPAQQLRGEAAIRAGLLAASQALFKAPRGVAVDKAGNIFVADATNHTIRKITIAGH